MIWFVLLFLTSFVFWKLHKANQYWKQKNVVHVKPLPLVGNFGQVVLRNKSVSQVAQEIYANSDSRYIGSYLLTTPVLIIRDLDLLKQITIKDFDHFTDHKSFFSSSDEVLVSRHLFGLKGKAWRNMRGILTPMFTSSKMRAMYTMMKECSEQLTAYCCSICSRSQPTTLQIKDLFTRYTNNVIGTCAFGIHNDALRDPNNEFYRNAKDVSNFRGTKTLRFFGHTFVPWLMKLFNIKIYRDSLYNYFKNIVLIAINTRQKEGILRNDMLHLMIEARKKYSETIAANPDADLIELDDDDVTAQVMLFFIAGTDTTSILLSYMSYELALNPDVQKKLQHEIDTTLEECGGDLTYETLLSMRYLDMVVQETLRKWPPVGHVDRECVKSYTIPPQLPGEKPVHLRRGDIVWIPIMGIHRDPHYYADPERFDPDRFSDENKKNIPDFSFLPFSVGPRNCIGYRFALLEAKIIFVNLLSKLNFVVVEKTDTTGKIDTFNIVLDLKHGHWLGLQLRK